ncbi:MAG: hypothetical protein VX836_16980 [Pseudomonadota bacterium]|nr:hypothetical protein [Pseudomonadota bacterium]
MSNKRWSAMLAAGLFSVLLAACGGGGGGNDDGDGGDGGGGGGGDGDKSSITLQGFVANAPSLSGGTVTATAGDKSADSAIGGDGSYTVTLDDLDLVDFVSVVAVGDGDNAVVEFEGLLGTVSAIEAAAGSDEAVTADDFAALALSSVTTAEAGLIQSAEAGKSYKDISSDEELAAALAALDRAAVTQLATSIQTVALYPTIPLPAGVTTTRSLAAASTVTQQDYARLLQVDYPDEYVAAAGSLPAGDAPTAADAVPGEFLLFYNSGENANQLSLIPIEFRSDNTGTRGASEFTWTVSGDDVIADVLSADTVVTVDVNGDGLIDPETERLAATVHLTLQFHTAGEAGLEGQTSVIESAVYAFDVADESVDDFTVRTTLYPVAISDEEEDEPAVVPFQTADVSGRTFAVNTVHEYVEGVLAQYPDTLSFNADGSGTSEQQGNFTWEIVDRILELSFVSGDFVEYGIVTKRSASVFEVGFIYERVGIENEYAAGSYMVEVDPDATFANGGVGGYHYNGVGTKRGPGTYFALSMVLQADGQGFERNAGNQAYSINGYALTPPADEIFVHEDYQVSRWALSEDGTTLDAEQYVDVQNNFAYCEPGSSDSCVVSDHWIFEIVRREGDFIYARAYESFPYTNDEANSFAGVNLYEYLPDDTSTTTEGRSAATSTAAQHVVPAKLGMPH